MTDLTFAENPDDSATVWLLRKDGTVEFDIEQVQLMTGNNPLGSDEPLETTALVAHIIQGVIDHFVKAQQENSNATSYCNHCNRSDTGGD